MNSLTKGAVLVSTLAAALLDLSLTAAAPYGRVYAFGLVGLAVAVLVGRRAPGLVLRVILLGVYLAPAIFLTVFGSEYRNLEIAWSLPLVGVLATGRDAWRWSLPTTWRWALVAWALFISLSWPIVFLREIAFAPWILQFPRVSNTGIGISPWEASQQVTYTVLVHNVGILWIDALFRWYSNGRTLFRASVLLPMAIGAAIACLVGAYQGFVDLTFVSGHLWPYMRRAAGTLADANAFGMIAAFWGTGFVVLALGLPRPWSIVTGAAGLGLAATGVWTSGSTTALVTMIIVVAAVVWETGRSWLTSEARSRPRTGHVVSIAVAVVVAAAAVFVIASGSSTIGQTGRGRLGFVPGFGDLGIRESARQLWDRFGYGSTAVQMIREHPLNGVGVGSFHTLVHDFGVITIGREIPPDNAQNWYRHLFAELGLLGSLPWIAWCLLFMWTLVSKARANAERASLGMLRGSFVGFALISLVGVPGQSLPVVLTFWTFVFWFASAKGLTGEEPDHTTNWSTGVWAATLVLVVLHSALTLADARGDLLPLSRAKRFDWYYRYGIGDLERAPDGSPSRRWTAQESLALIKVQGRVLKFVGWIDHPDADENPVHVRVTADSALVFDGELKRSAAIRLDIPAQEGARHLVLQTWISRTWKPADVGRPDGRELGLAMQDWRWE